MQQQIDRMVEKIPKISSVFRDNCCETCRKIPQKTPMEKFTEINCLRQMFFGTSAANSND